MRAHIFPPLAPPVNAILLTIFVGFVLVGFFVLLFVLHRRDAESSSAERDSLMPLEEEMTRVVGRRPTSRPRARP
jgi:hypothetical protein